MMALYLMVDHYWAHTTLVEYTREGIFANSFGSNSGY